MKLFTILLTALTAVSSFADTARISTRDGVQTLRIKNTQFFDDEGTVLGEAVDQLLTARKTLKVLRTLGAERFEGDYILGGRFCRSGHPGGCTGTLEITQEIDERYHAKIENWGDGLYAVRGPAADELAAALIESGAKRSQSSMRGRRSSVETRNVHCFTIHMPLPTYKWMCKISVHEPMADRIEQ